MMTRAFCLSTVLLAGTAPAAAQLISIRTVPISQSHQFDLFPSQRMDMGGASIALPDSLLDPFANPAKGGRFGAGRFFSSPGVYSVSSGAGSGRALPLGALARAGNWYAGLMLTAQQVDLSERAAPFLAPCPDPVPLLPAPAPQTCNDVGPDDRSHGNTYAFAMLGKLLPEAGLSFGGSVSWAGLHAVDGVDLLYPGNARLNQDGTALDVRVGALKEWAGGRSLAALALHNRFASTHDVIYLDGFWDPGAQTFSQRPRVERNLDHTNTWGLHVDYVQPLAAGWRLGWLATANVMSHPKIPNYEIQNIPRDPGNSTAFNFGVGFSRSSQGTSFGLDLIYEPIWSYTWADAEAAVETARGDFIPAGGKTIENRFRFWNAVVRMGVEEELPFDQATRAIGLRLGLAARRIHYTLAQQDNVRMTARSLEESWVEWTPTWGLGLRFPSWEIRYRGSLTHGTGRPGIARPGSWDIAAAESTRGVILVAPSGPLTLTEISVMTHQVSVSFPFR